MPVNGGKKGLGQRVMGKARRMLAALLMLFVAGMAQGVLAGQDTQANPIGYSPEGRYFAYEEFGFREGGSQGFSTIYLVDLVQVSHVVGTPVTHSAPLSEQTLPQIRQRAYAEAEMILKSLQVREPATIVAMIGDGQLGVEENRLVFGVPTPDSVRKITGRYTLSLNTFETSSTIPCPDYLDTPPLGFSLSMESFGSSLDVYVDRELPRSRECPHAYRLVSVILPFGATDISKGVGLVSVLTRGPQGDARHFIAVPLAFGIRGMN